MNGKTTINEEVFVELAKTAMTKVVGVFPETDAKNSLASFAKLLAERFIPQIIVKKTDADPVTDTKGIVSFDMRLSLLYGANIPEAVAKVREAIKQEVETIACYQVEKIDIIVEKLVKPEKPEPAAPVDAE